MNNEMRAREIAEHIPKCRNVDNDDLLPWDKLNVGNVWEVNGPGAEELPAFIPTRAELFELARDWATVAIWRQFVGCANQTYSDTEWRLICYAWRRVERIRGLIGDDLVDQVIDEQMKALYEERGSHCDPDIWAQFMAQVNRDSRRDWLPPLKSLSAKETFGTC